MLGLVSILSLAACACAKLHHIYVGQAEGPWIYALETDDEARTIYLMGQIPSSGASPSLVLDRSKKFLFGSAPTNGTLTRYHVQADYSLINDGTADIPASCNTTKFNTLQLYPNAQGGAIFGSASTGECSTVFALDITGFTTLRSKEFAGDIRSLAWSPNGRHLHALDSHASTASVTSIFNFFIGDDTNLVSMNATDILANVTNAAQIIAHPTGNRVYVVTRDTNELIAIPTLDDAFDGAKAPSRFKLLPSSMDASIFSASSLAISSSKESLWTLSQSPSQAVISVFSLDPTTGDVTGSISRAAWSGYGSGMISPAPFVGQDMVAITNSPSGMIAFLGLDKAAAAPAGQTETVHIDGDDFLEEVWQENMVSEAVAAPKIKSYGRMDLGLDTLGEGAWVD